MLRQELSNFLWGGGVGQDSERSPQLLLFAQCWGQGTDNEPRWVFNLSCRVQLGEEGSQFLEAWAFGRKINEMLIAFVVGRPFWWFL